MINYTIDYCVCLLLNSASNLWWAIAICSLPVGLVHIVAIQLSLARRPNPLIWPSGRSFTTAISSSSGRLTYSVMVILRNFIIKIKAMLWSTAQATIILIALLIKINT